MQLSPEEIKHIRKSLLLNLIAATLVIGIALIIYFTAGHNYEMIGFFGTVLGLIWTIMTVAKMIKFKKFLEQNQN